MKSFTSSENHPQFIQPDQTTAKSVRILGMGDSYTFGEGVDQEERWINQLAVLLGDYGYYIQELTIIAKTGWTTGELSQAIAQSGVQHKYDLVTVLIGVNNQYRGLSISDYRIEFTEILTKAKQHADNNPKHVLVLSIPDWGHTSFAAERDRNKISREIESFNLINRDITNEFQSYYLDITTITREALDDQTLLAADGLHPSKKMYSIWASEALAQALEILSTPTIR
jgi:lysophospholipase L1-like esterase